jgi:ATP-dependent helicase HepA
VASKTEFTEGQRWASEMEPELGVGIVEAVDGRRIHLNFPDSGVVRIYAVQSAPLHRVVLHPGDRVVGENGTRFTISAVETEAGLNVYTGEGMRLREDRMAGMLTLDTPKERLMAGQRDPSTLFDLRRRVLGYRSRMARSAVHGFVGGRVELIPHQFAIAAEVSGRRAPRVLLADETGLGKTIEAGLILHRLTTLGRVNRILVIVPDALVVQWFVELARRFNLRFRILDEGPTATQAPAADTDDPFLDEPYGLCGFSYLAAASPSLLGQLRQGGWDMLVVDEAHHLRPGGELFARVQQLSETARRVILITATPGHLQAQSHFARLRLLDPHRYTSYEQFKTESRAFEQIARTAQALAAGSVVDARQLSDLAGLIDLPVDEIKSQLMNGAGRRRLLLRFIDRHGTGRVMFKTTRRTVSGFPGRRAHLVPLNADSQGDSIRRRLDREVLMEGGPEQAAGAVVLADDPRVAWLEDFLRRRREEKILLICSTSRKVNALYEELEKRMTIKVGRYHEGMTLVQRDRNAAWFAEPDGAVLLLCSEIGSEGRNFQFARHLVLFDLPVDAELLEQRIGRLDRIGQRGVVNVFVPCVSGSAGEILARWYHEALNAFEQHVPAAGWVTRRFLNALTALIDNPDRQAAEARLERLIRSGRISAARQQRQIESGRDRLLELDALPPEQVQALIEEIRATDGDAGFVDMAERLLDVWGIVMEPIAAGIYRLSPDHRYADPLPGFRPSGLTVTTDRATALTREDLGFLTWDHPLVTGAMDLFLGKGKGNAAFAHWPASGRPEVFLEMLFVIESAAAAGGTEHPFLPPMPIRVVVDGRLKDRTNALPDPPAHRLVEGPAPLFAKMLPEAARLLPDMVEAGRTAARTRAVPIIEEAARSAGQRMDDAVDRLTSLGRENAAIRQSEISALKKERQAVLAVISNAQVRLDALRLILKGEL